LITVAILTVFDYIATTAASTGIDFIFNYHTFSLPNHLV